MRLTEDRVQLEFESTIPLLGREFRTKRSRAGRPPYYELVALADGKHFVVAKVENPAHPGALAFEGKLSDVHAWLQGIQWADQQIAREEVVEPVE